MGMQAYQPQLVQLYNVPVSTPQDSLTNLGFFDDVGKAFNDAGKTMAKGAKEVMKGGAQAASYAMKHPDTIMQGVNTAMQCGTAASAGDVAGGMSCAKGMAQVGAKVMTGQQLMLVQLNDG